MLLLLLLAIESKQKQTSIDLDATRKDCTETEIEGLEFRAINALIKTSGQALEINLLSNNNLDRPYSGDKTVLYYETGQKYSATFCFCHSTKSSSETLDRF